MQDIGVIQNNINSVSLLVLNFQNATLSSLVFEYFQRIKFKLSLILMFVVSDWNNKVALLKFRAYM